MSGTNKWTMLSAIGGEMLEVRDGYAKARLPLSETVQQPTRVFHAGAIVTLADEVASAAIHWRSGCRPGISKPGQEISIFNTAERKLAHKRPGWPPDSRSQCSQKRRGYSC